MSKFRYKNNFPELEIKNTKKYGKGVFASSNIENGDIVYMLNGERMDIRDFVTKVNSDHENIDDPFQIGKRTYYDLNEISRTFNHSCDPSAGLRKNGELFALRDIRKGEEITYDYSLTVAPTDWKMRCLCGSKLCRKILGDITTVPKSRMLFYKKRGAIQRYMKTLLPSIESGSYTLPPYEVKALAELKKTSEI